MGTQLRWLGRCLGWSVRRSVGVVFAVIGAIVTPLMVAAALLAVRLEAGPVSLDALVPHLRDLLARSAAADLVGFRTLTLDWRGRSAAIDVKVVGLSLATREGETIVHVPAAEFSFDPAALLAGQVLPQRVLAVSPLANLVWTGDGRLALGVRRPRKDIGPGPGTGTLEGRRLAVQRMLDAIAEARARDALETIHVIDGTLVVRNDELGAPVTIGDIAVQLDRIPKGVSGVARATVRDTGPGRGTRLMRVVAFADLDSDARSVRFDVAVDLPDPNRLQALVPAGSPTLVRISSRVQALVEGTMGLDSGTVESTFGLKAGAGVVEVGAPINHAFPVERLVIAGDLDSATGRLSITDLQGQLIGPDGPELSTAVEFRHQPGRVGLGLQAVVDGLTLDSLITLWPEAAAPPTRRWIAENLEAGDLGPASLDLHLAGDDGIDSLAPASLVARVPFSNAIVHYVRPMPPITNGRAEVTATLEQIEVSAATGRVGSLALESGRVTFTNLKQRNPDGQVRIRASGPTADALALIDSEPMRFAAALNLDPDRVSGSAVADVTIGFPLKFNYTREDFEVDARATLTDSGITAVVFGQDFTDADLELRVRTRDMALSGNGLLGGVPVSLVWDEAFTRDRPARSRLQVQAAVAPSDIRRFGLPLPPDDLVPLGGTAPLSAEVAWTWDRVGSVAVEADLTPVAAAVPVLDWTKPAGTAATLSATATLDGTRLDRIDRARITASDGATLEGSATLQPDGSAATVIIDRARLGRSDLRDVILRVLPHTEGAVAATVGGGRLDLVPLLEDRRESPHEDEAAEPPEPTFSPARPEHGLEVTVQAALDEVWFDEDTALGPARVDLSVAATGAVRGTVSTVLGSGTPMVLRVSPPQTGRGIRFRLETGDAGELLRTFGVTDQVVGGSLQATGLRSADGVILGDLQMERFNLVRAPLLARIGTVAALTGIPDALRGDGIRFDTLRLPFRWHDGRLGFEDAGATGTSIGVTAEGLVDLRADRLDVSGTLVPANLLNQLPAQLPVLGELFSGGVVAFTYRAAGPIDDPSLTVNPLSALAPGVLRDLLPGVGAAQ